MLCLGLVQNKSKVKDYTIVLTTAGLTCQGTQSKECLSWCVDPNLKIKGTCGRLHRSVIVHKCMFIVRPSNATHWPSVYLSPYRNSSTTQRKHPWALLSASRPSLIASRHQPRMVQGKSERANPYVRDLSTLLEPGTSCIVYGMPHAFFRSDPYIHTYRRPLHFSSSKKTRIRDDYRCNELV